MRKDQTLTTMEIAATSSYYHIRAGEGEIRIIVEYLINYGTILTRSNAGQIVTRTRPIMSHHLTRSTLKEMTRSFDL